MSAPPNYTNVTLMKAMGVKKYDPMPTPQHQWQRADGEPMIHRIWSVLCACSIMARLIGGRLVTTPYATEEDGVSPLTLVRMAKLLGEDDGGDVRRGWRLGEELGIWRRESGKLWLNPEVSKVQINEAKKQRKKVCTHLLTRGDLLKIKSWPKERREEFQGLWNAVHDYEQARIAEATGRERDILAPVKDSIKTRFDLEIRHVDQPARKAAVVPHGLLEFVQTGLCSPGNGAVHTAPSLLGPENYQSEPSASSKGTSVVETELKKEAATTAAIPIRTPDMAAAQNPRRQPPEPSKMGEVQSGDHDNLLADAARYADAVRNTATEAGVGTTSQDGAVIEAWRRAKVPLETVRRALFLGALRQFISAVNNGGSAPALRIGVNSLRYCRSLIAEVQSSNAGPLYWEHNEAFLKRQRERFDQQAKTAGGTS